MDYQPAAPVKHLLQSVNLWEKTLVPFAAHLSGHMTTDTRLQNSLKGGPGTMGTHTLSASEQQSKDQEKAQRRTTAAP